MRHKGFSLIEVLVVVAIIGIVVSIALPKLVFNPHRNRSAAARVFMQHVKAARSYAITRRVAAGFELSYYPSTLKFIIDDGEDRWRYAKRGTFDHVFHEFIRIRPRRDLFRSQYNIIGERQRTTRITFGPTGKIVHKQYILDPGWRDGQWHNLPATVRLEYSVVDERIPGGMVVTLWGLSGRMDIRKQG